MLLTITTTHNPATELGYLLSKNPANLQTFDLAFGKAHVLYPEASDAKCTAALLLDIDPVQLVRGKGRDSDGGVDQYANDRPYVSSSFMSVAIAQVFGSALNGRSRDRQELADTAIPLSLTLSAVPCRENAQILHRLFEPLGYTVTATSHILDEKFPQWGESPYYTLTLSKTCRLHELLTHIYVLIPVLDNAKHYAFGDDEVEKLLRRGEGWLAQHPEVTFITNRYLSHRRRLTQQALDQLVEDDIAGAQAAEEAHSAEEAKLEERISLNEQRMNTVVSVLKSLGATTVVDLGCGQGKLLRGLLDHKEFKRIVGMDVSYSALEQASYRMKLDHMPDRQRERIELIHGSLTYRDPRLAGFDAATCIEVIEHLDPYRLTAFERVLFEFAQPRAIVLTTPNVEYNAKFETLPAGKMRHKDHRFEWTRAEFQHWANYVADRHSYSVRYLPVGEENQDLGAPTQMAVFTK